MGQAAKIVITIPGTPDSTMELVDRMSIGRSASNQLIVPDQNASRRHCEIRSVGVGRFRLFDVGSANGTWLNGRRLTVPRDLESGDQITIGNVILTFVAPSDSMIGEPSEDTMGTGLFATAVAMRNQTVVILVSDVRNYTSMSETLPVHDFSRLISDWFRECSAVIETNGGIIDKFIGDAVMCYWAVPMDNEGGIEVNNALKAAQEMIELAEKFSLRLSSQFPGHAFRVGIGLNIGTAIYGNVGTSQHQSFTIVGDCVNVAFRLEALCKERKAHVIVSRAIAELAEDRFNFTDLGQAEVKGRREPVPILALKLESQTKY